jgi:DNA-binding SARP family transcriptional activator/predicted ATPase
MLHIRLLGGFQILHDQVPLGGFNSARLQSLLAYLVLHAGVSQPRHYLSFLLWPDSSEEQARTNLRKLIFQLRQALPEPDVYLLYDSQTIQWNAAAPYTLDVTEMDRLLRRVERNPLDRDALVWLVEEFTGELLPACYDDWIAPLRQIVARGVRRGLEQLVALLEQQRDYEEGIRYAQRLLDLDPLEESSYTQLMRLRALKGDRAGALRVYHDCVTMLRRELEVEPNEATQQAYQQILNRTVSVDAAADLPPLADTTVLVGRAREWQEFQSALDRAVRGHAHLAIVGGEAGIGKTRLAEELLGWAGQKGCLVARTRAHAAQGVLSYAPVTELLRTPALRSRLNRLNDDWLVELSRVLPELREAHPQLPAPQPVHESWQRQRFFEALARALLVDEQPLVLLFDDLQWCDREMLEWLHYLLHFKPAARLLMLATLRTDEITPGHPFMALQLALGRTEQFSRIDLAPLDAEATAALAAQLADGELDAAQVARLVRETQGNPLFVVETVRAQMDQRHDPAFHGEPALTGALSDAASFDMPPKVYAVLQSRLAHLSPQAQEMVGLAAAIGRSFTFDVLVAASGQAEDELVNGLDELWQRRIILEDGVNAYDFSHDRLRAVAYAGISRPRQRLLHRRVAEALRQVYGDSRTVSLEMAHHYEQAGLLDMAIASYCEAAVAGAHFAASQSILQATRNGLELLHQLPETPERLQQEMLLQTVRGATLTAFQGFTAPEVFAAYARAHELSRRTPHTPQLAPRIAPVLMGLGVYYLVRGEIQIAHEFGQELMALGGQVEDKELQIAGQLAVGVTSYYRGQLAQAVEHLEAVLRLGDDEAMQPLSTVYGQDFRTTCLNYLPLVYWLLGEPDQALARAATAIARAERLQHPYVTAVTEHFLSVLHCVRQDADAVAACTSEVARLAEQHGFAHLHQLNQVLDGWALAQRGEAGAAIEQILQALAVLDRMGVQLARPFYLTLLAGCYQLHGHRGQALATLNHALTNVYQSGHYLWEPELERMRVMLLLQEGLSPVEAGARLQEALALAQRLHARALALRIAVELARLRQHDSPAQARALLLEIYNEFPAGQETKELRSAQELLQELNP